MTVKGGFLRYRFGGLILILEGLIFEILRYFKIKTCWIVAQFLAHKLGNFALLNYLFKIIETVLWSWTETR